MNRGRKLEFAMAECVFALAAFNFIIAHGNAAEIAELLAVGRRKLRQRVFPDISILFLYLVGGLEHFLFFHILGIIIPID